MGLLEIDTTVTVRRQAADGDTVCLIRDREPRRVNESHGRLASVGGVGQRRIG
jgi:hypothetical protein